jgi:6-phosphogluconolactonase (cycloisomerase 2 family)
MKRSIGFVTCLALFLVGCGGGGSGSGASSSPPPPPPPATYTIGGTVSGLDVGQSVILQNDGGDNLTVSANGAFTFAAKISSGGSYAVTVGTQPQGMGCAVASGSGTAYRDVSNVAVACGGPYAVGGTVSGLVGQGLELVLGPQHLGITGNGIYEFPTNLYADGSGFSVSIAQQPQSPAQECIVQNPYITRTPPDVSDVSDVNIVCGEFIFVANSAADSISAYSIDPSSGALFSDGPTVAAHLEPSAIAGTINKKYLYVSNNRSNDVSAFDYGSLTTVAGSPFAAGTSPSAVAVFTSTWCTNSHHGANTCGYDMKLFVANAGSDTVSAYQIDQSTGVLRPASPASHATGTGPSAMAVGPGVPHIPLLYIANSGSNDISAFEIDGSAGSLRSVVGSPFPSKGNVSSLAFGAGDAFVYPPGTSNGTPNYKGLLYAANASGDTASIMGFSIHPSMGGDANFGALTPLPGLPYDLPSCNYIVTDQTGAYLYATAGTKVFGFSIDYQTGALSPLPGSPIAVGDTADSLSIDPANQFLYVTNHSAGRVTGFKLNAATGELTTMPGSPFAVSQPADFVATF